MKSPRILVVDLENSPLVGYTWELYEQNVLKIVKPWYILCFAYKWLEEGSTKVVALPDFKLYKKQPENDYEVVKRLHELFDQADIILAQNGDAFDVKKANARFIFHKMTPPSQYKTIDTLKIARRYFKFTSNKLGDLGEYFGLGRKVSTGGFELWDRCMNKDMEAWALMKKYNKRDVDLLEKVYIKLRPWAKTHPNLAMYSEENVPICPNCQSKKIQRRGYTPTNSLWYRRFQCQDCTTWFKGRESVGRTRPSN